MKCTNRKNGRHNRLRIRILAFLAAGSLFLAGCGGSSYEMAYSPDYPVSAFRLTNPTGDAVSATPFAADLCVVSEDITDDANVDMSGASAAGLFDINRMETLYAKNVYEQLYPASLTKVMTALVALKDYPDALSQVLTASANVRDLESGAQVCGLREGDRMTLDQALHVLLVNSANDAAILIAEGLAGTVEAFADRMNEVAAEIGATNSHFVNPHGLSDDNHYVTAYDMYLIFNEALKYDLFGEIIHMDSYSTVYQDKNGASKELSVNSTNLYLRSVVPSPESVTVIGGKTGTTSAAGHCLVLLSRDTSGNPYISVILRSEGQDVLYDEMTDLLNEIRN